MQKLPKQVYMPEYRAQAVRLMTGQTKSIPQAARELGMSVKILANWVLQGAARGQRRSCGIVQTAHRVRDRGEPTHTGIGRSEDGERHYKKRPGLPTSWGRGEVRFYQRPDPRLLAPGPLSGAGCFEKRLSRVAYAQALAAGSGKPTPDARLIGNT